jgi:alkyl sulfatase BDS1-like metallo-beta-lactamase superfamily hydrolase
LYGVAPASVAADVVKAAGSDALVEAARRHVDEGRPVQALHLTDLVLAAEPADKAARSVALDAHEALRASTENFWEKAWLTKSIEELGTGG